VPATEERVGLDRDLVVVERVDAADGVVALALADPHGAALPRWSPGAHIDVALTDTLVRQYSLCGDPADTGRWRIAVLREAGGRGGSDFVHDKLHLGSTVPVRELRNNFALARSPRYLFVAGGIGITPILPMLAAADAAGADWRLLYGGRTRASMAFLDELAVYGERLEIAPQDEAGLLDLDRWLARPRADTLVYCCGPAPLLAAVEQRCARWPGDVLRVERFRPVELDPAGTRPFALELSLSGRRLTVPADRSALEVLEEAGIPILSSCREGTCGTCETYVLAGEVDHRDSLLTDAERAANDVMYVCVSRARSDRLVVEW
jgi:ferredoxin-NADP reductase